MPRYLVLSPTWVHAVGTVDTDMQSAGAVIDYAGQPGVSLFPLDDPARAARLAFIRTRNHEQRVRDELRVRRFRAGLDRPIQAQLDAAVADFELYRAEQEEAAAARARR